MELTFTLTAIDAAAADFIQHIQHRRVIALHGEMGAGKTTFVHAVCKVLGVSDVVSSPTFSIVNQYLEVDNQPIYHIDLYRLNNEAEAINAGIEDCLDSGCYCFVEWPEKAPSLLPENTVQVYIDTVDTDTRKLSFNSLPDA